MLTHGKTINQQPILTTQGTLPPMRIPNGKGLPGDEIVKILIGIKGDGSIVMNSLAKSNGSELFVEISSDERLTHQRFIDVVNYLKGEAITKVSIID